MTPAALLSELSRRGVLVCREGDRLSLEGERTSLTPVLVDRVRTLKASLLEILPDSAGGSPDEILFEERLAMRLDAGFSMDAAHRLAITDVGRIGRGGSTPGALSTTQIAASFDADALDAIPVFLSSDEEQAVIVRYSAGSRLST